MSRVALAWDAVLDAVFGAALRGFPVAFRREYGAEMRLLFTARRQRVRAGRGPAAEILFTLQSALNVAREGLQERVDTWRRRGPGPNRLDIVRQDLAYAGRVLRRRPGFALLATFTLALGIGANSAVFSLAHAVLLRPLAFPDSDRLFVLDETRVDGRPGFASARSFRAWATALEGTAQVAAIDPWGEMNLEVGTRPERVRGTRVTPDYFAVMGVRPLAGRSFRPDEAITGGPATLILGERLWRDRFNADPGIVGSLVRLHGEGRLVVGVMPAIASDPQISGWADLWVPLPLDTPGLDDSPARWLRVVGRARPGVDHEQVTALAASVQQRLAREHPRTHANRAVVARTLQRALAGDAERRLVLLTGAVALLLLIACGNVASLLVTRGVERSTELTVRAALGAGRGRLAAQLIVEGLVVGVIGGAAGLALASVALPLLTRMAAASLPPGIDIGLDAVVVTFTFVTAVGAGLAISILPTAWASRQDMSGALRERHASRGPVGTALRRALVVGELATTVVLLSGLTLILQSVAALNKVDTGFAPDRLVSVGLTLPKARYVTPEARQQFYAALIERVERIPEVERAGAIDFLPLEGGWQKQVYPAGQPLPAPGEEPFAYSKPVMPGTFAALGIPLLAGRDITAADVATQAPVVVIDEAAAQRFWPGVDPLGRQVRHAIDGPLLTIVGLVGPVTQSTLTDGFRPGIYHPYPARNDLQLVVRTTAAPSALVGDIRRAVQSLDADLPIGPARTGEALLERTLGAWRVDLALVAMFAGAALLLSSVGIFGVVSSTVAQRSREIGIRMALGATRPAVQRQVLAEALRTALAGVSIGVPLSVLVARAASFRLFGVSPLDPLTIGAVLAILLLVTVVASYLPARRAAMVDPAFTLRGN